MQQLDVLNYRPPFITETDEIRWDDCTVCSTLMATASATTGETVARPSWAPMSKTEMKVLRERIRNYLGPDDQTGGTNMADMRVAFAKEYPWLPQIPSYAEQRNSWSECRDRLLKGWGGIYMGNPSQVSDQNSKLRRWTTNDNFGHAIWVDRARQTSAGATEYFVMDPLGRGTYSGEWVPEQDLREYTWTYDAAYVYVTLFKRGSWNASARENQKLTARAERLESEVQFLNDKIEDMQRMLARKTAEVIALEAKEEVLISQNQRLILEAERLEQTNEQLEARVDSLRKTIKQKNEQIRTLQAKLAKCKQG
jgi:chaperonin cofactor prefoldin/DNA-directed RNA polymerase subunit M/transcription elongation factor TFIIS